MEVLNFLTENSGEILIALLAIVGGLKTLSTFTPNKSDDAFLQGAYDLLNKLALNVRHDKNAE